MLVFRRARILAFVMAAAALGGPNIASAVTFDGPGVHTLTALDLRFSATFAAGVGGRTCADSSFTVNVPAGGATATVTAASFTHCTGTGIAGGTTATPTATNLPWEITTQGVAGTFVIDGIHINNVFDPTGAQETLEGSLTGTFNNATHVATFANSPGLTATGSLGTAPGVVSGVFTDNLNTLAIT